MASSRLSKVRLVGVASAVPDRKRSVADDLFAFGDQDAKRIIENTGVKRRHVADVDVCTSDLCFWAAEKLMVDLAWERDSIDALVFVSQTPDYPLPATSCSLHGRLRLSKACAAFDVNMGCSGYVYGFWIASQLIASNSAQRVLLLVGDTISHMVSPRDRSTAHLFGDAGTATALRRDDDAPDIVFELGTDGSGADHLIVPAGGHRQPRTPLTSTRTERESGNVRSDEDLFMNGPEVFGFTLREVPTLIKSVIQAVGWQVEEVDAWVLHQANRFMLQHLTKRIGLPADKVALAIEEYGNTSSASIPLTMTHTLAERLKGGKLQMILAGFGVGFSWGALALTAERVVMPELLLVSVDCASGSPQGVRA